MQIKRMLGDKTLRRIKCRTGPRSQFGLSVEMMTEREFRRHHEQIAARLRSMAANVTTPAVRARIIEQAKKYERLAALLADLDQEILDAAET
jgi:DNA-binding Lrp family transcriptional regulator